MRRFLLALCAAVALGCGGDGAVERAKLDLPFVSFSVKSLFFGPRTESAGLDPYSIVITGAERDQACRDPSALPTGSSEVLVVLKPGERGWPDPPFVCALGEELVNCSAQVTVYRQNGRERTGWSGNDGVVIVHDLTPDRVNLELEVDVGCAPRICDGPKCRTDPGACGGNATATDRLSLLLDAELCPAACVCGDKEAKDACACKG